MNAFATWPRAIRASLAGLLAFAAFAPASAAPFQQYLNGTCTGLTCKIDFRTVPAGKRLVVDNVSCYVRLKDDNGSFAPNIKFQQVLVVGANPNKILNALTMAPIYVSRIDDETVYSANHAVTAFANANQHFQAVMEIDRGEYAQFACHVSGETTNA